MIFTLPVSWTHAHRPVHEVPAAQDTRAAHSAEALSNTHDRTGGESRFCQHMARADSACWAQGWSHNRSTCEPTDAGTAVYRSCAPQYTHQHRCTGRAITLPVGGASAHQQNGLFAVSVGPRREAEHAHESPGAGLLDYRALRTVDLDLAEASGRPQHQHLRTPKFHTIVSLETSPQCSRAPHSPSYGGSPR